jgi:hypothetical protein
VLSRRVPWRRERHSAFRRSLWWKTWSRTPVDVCSRACARTVVAAQIAASPYGQRVALARQRLALRQARRQSRQAEVARQRARAAFSQERRALREGRHLLRRIRTMLRQPNHEGGLHVKAR